VLIDIKLVFQSLLQHDSSVLLIVGTASTGIRHIVHIGLGVTLSQRWCRTRYASCFKPKKTRFLKAASTALVTTETQCDKIIPASGKHSAHVSLHLALTLA